MKKPWKKDFVIVCDDFREEIRNKISLMGIFSGNIQVEKFPAQLPSLCFAIFIQGIQIPIETISPIIKMPDQTVKVLDKIKPTLLDDKESNLNLLLKLSPAKISKSGKISLSLMINDEEKPAFKYSIDVIAFKA